MRSPILPLLVLVAALGAFPASASAADLRLAPAGDRYVRKQVGLMVALSAWSALNIAGGTALLVTDPLSRSADPGRARFRRSFGAMALGYGVVNAVLAALTFANLPRKRGSLTTASGVETQRRESTEVFAINAGLDMLSIGIGATVWATSRSPTARGTTAGVVSQGVFLLGFDTTAAMVYRY